MSRERAAAYQAALATVGGLSTPSKMPCRSWSTPAKRCIVGSKLAASPGTICSKCYARKGMYVLPNVEAAMERRFKLLKAALNDWNTLRLFEEAFVTIMRIRFDRSLRLRASTGRIGRDDGRFFRWHDSGDLHGVEHLRLLNRIALRCPDTAFWLPTKEVGTVETFLKAERLARNLTVRLSLPRIDSVDAPASYWRLVKASPSVVLANAHSMKPAEGFEECNAVHTDHECRTCRACWGRDHVSYRVI